MGKLIGGFAALVAVVVIVAYAYNQGFLGEAKNKDISNTRWQVAINQVNDHVLEVGRIDSQTHEVTVKKVGTQSVGTGTYLGSKLVFTLSNGNLAATLTGNVSRDGKNMSGTILTTSPAVNTQQDFTAVKL